MHNFLCESRQDLQIVYHKMHNKKQHMNRIFQNNFYTLSALHRLWIQYFLHWWLHFIAQHTFVEINVCRVCFDTHWCVGNLLALEFCFCVGSYVGRVTLPDEGSEYVASYTSLVATWVEQPEIGKSRSATVNWWPPTRHWRTKTHQNPHRRRI